MLPRKLTSTGVKQNTVFPPSALQRIISVLLNKEGRKAYQVPSQYCKVLFNFPTQPSPVCFHTLRRGDSCTEGHLCYGVEIFRCSMRYRPVLFTLAHYVAFVNSPAGICGVRSHQMFPGKLVSPVSQTAIRRVALCQTRTDWPSAENQLTYDLLAVIHIPPAAVSQSTWQLQSPGTLLLSPTCPHPCFFSSLDKS